MYEKLARAYDSLRSQTDFCPMTGIVLGSGLGDFVENVDVKKIVPYSSILDFPVSTVSGHTGQFVFGYIGKNPVVIMQGRVHYYEGYAMQDVVMPIRLMALMNIKSLILTNAAGGVNTDFHEGALMAITDHICLAPNPLIGRNMDKLGLRFPDMTTAYDKNLLKTLRKCASELKIDLREGVYVQFTGPSYETPAEVKMARIMGGDAVGMSTACEAIAANHAKVKVCGISCITNMAAGITGKALTHEEVSRTALRVKKEFSTLLKEFVINI